MEHAFFTLLEKGLITLPTHSLLGLVLKDVEMWGRIESKQQRKRQAKDEDDCWLIPLLLDGKGKYFIIMLQM